MSLFSWHSKPDSSSRASSAMSSDASSGRSLRSEFSGVESKLDRASSMFTKSTTAARNSISNFFSEISFGRDQGRSPAANQALNGNIGLPIRKSIARRFSGAKHKLSGHAEPYKYEAVFSSVKSDPVKVGLELTLRFEPKNPEKFSHLPTELLARTPKAYSLADLRDDINTMCTHGEVPEAIQKKLLEEIQSEAFSRALNLVER